MSPGTSVASCCGVKRARIFSGDAGSQPQIVLPAVAPPSPAERLQQEHVVGIGMRADAAAGRRVAHHQVVEARERNEREAAQQRVGGVAVQVHALHQQRPVARRQSPQFRDAKRALGERVPTAGALHEP